MSATVRLAALTALPALLGLLLTVPAAARYARPDLENVPIARLIDNLEQQAKKNPKDAALRLNLARAHAMAYASKSDTASIWKGRENQGVWFGYEPKHIPFEVKKTTDAAKQKEAQDHLKKAQGWYDDALKVDPNSLPSLLGRAWVLEQAGEKDKALAAYRATIEKAWATEKDLRAGRLGGRYFTAEAADYLIPLLDANRDKKEIAELKERSTKLRKLPRPVTPIAVPLEDGLTASDLVDEGARVAFDANGSGERNRWTWLTPRAGWLVYDPQKKGKVESALQMFGSVTFWMFWDDGYQALSALDDNGDGVLGERELEGLAIWHDGNSNGVCDPGEVKQVGDWGIVALSCRADRATPAGCAAWARAGVTYRSGKVRPTFDVILKQR